MKLRTGAPEWFNEEHPERQAKCVSFPATREYDPWYGDIDEDIEEDEDLREEIKRDNDLMEAVYICHGVYDGIQCPLLEVCLEFAMDNNERYGVWGGMLPEDRAALRKERRSLSSIKAGDQSQRDG